MGGSVAPLGTAVEASRNQLGEFLVLQLNRKAVEQGRRCILLERPADRPAACQWPSLWSARVVVRVLEARADRC